MALFIVGVNGAGGLSGKAWKTKQDLFCEVTGADNDGFTPHF